MRRQLSDPPLPSTRMISSSDLFKGEKLQLPFLISHTEQTFFKSLDMAWHENTNSTKSTISALSIPMCDRLTILTIYYFLFRLSTSSQALRVLYIVETKRRKSVIEGLAERIRDNYLHNIQHKNMQRVNLGGPFDYSTKESQLVTLTFQEYISEEIFKPEPIEVIFLQTSHLSKTISSGVQDYITDTYVRRAYIECCNLIQSYKKNPIQKDDQPSQSSQEDNIEFPLVNLVSKRKSEMQRQHSQEKENSKTVDGATSLIQTYQQKKVALKENARKGKQNKRNFFEDNELILLSIFSYILGFLQNSLGSWKLKSTKNIDDFLNDFQNKTLLSRKILSKMMDFYEKIMRNCPSKEYSHQKTYLYAICNFFKKIMALEELFHHEHSEIFEIRIQKFPYEKNEAIFDESSSAIRLCCTNNRLSALKILEQKSGSIIFVENLGSPPDYWKKIYGGYIKYENQDLDYSKLFGVHISKTPSNEDLNFGKKERADIESIKMKACGVLFCQLAKFIPDGMVVYFHSIEGLQAFKNEMQKDEQKILSQMNNLKKVFFESQFEEENIMNYQKFKKYCSIGRGGVFIMTTNSRMARKHDFYHNLSNCILFIGFPERKPQHSSVSSPGDTEKIKEIEAMAYETEKISIFNMCLNNCINDLNETKTILFIGREIPSNVQANWYNTFIKRWDETTRESLPELRRRYQQMKSELPTIFDN